jgi:hypothetical protein
MDVTPGKESTEFKLTRLAFMVGTLLEVVAATLHSLQAGGVSAPWFPAVLTVVGVALQVLPLVGYQKSRTLVKAEAARAAAPDDAAALVREVQAAALPRPTAGAPQP